MIQEGRATGKTTRLLLQAANALSEGKRVLIITHAAYHARDLSRRLHQLLVGLTGVECTRATSDRVEFFGGHAVFATRDSLEMRIHGCTFDDVFTDSVELTIDEQMFIAPSMSVTDIEYFQTEYENDDLLHEAHLYDSAYQNLDIDLSDPAPPAPQERVRKIFSSR